MSRTLYSPRLSDDMVRALYREGQRLRMPMTRLADDLLRQRLGATPEVHPVSRPMITAWKCSDKQRDKQRDLILKLVDEHQLDKHAIEALAIERFCKGVRVLNKIEASGLIDELLDTHGHNNAGNGNARRRNGAAYKGAKGGNPRPRPSPHE